MNRIYLIGIAFAILLVVVILFVFRARVMAMFGKAEGLFIGDTSERMAKHEKLFIGDTSERATAEPTSPFPKAEKPLTFIQTEGTNEFERGILDESDPYRYSMVFNELSHNLHPMGYYGEGRKFGPVEKFGPMKMTKRSEHMLNSSAKLFLDAYKPIKGECVPGWVPDRVRTDWVGGLEFPTKPDSYNSFATDPVAKVMAE